MGLITLFRDPVTFLTVSGSHYSLSRSISSLSLTFLTVSGVSLPLSGSTSFSYS